MRGLFSVTLVSFFFLWFLLWAIPLGCCHNLSLGGAGSASHWGRDELSEGVASLLCFGERGFSQRGLAWIAPGGGDDETDESEDCGYSTAYHEEVFIIPYVVGEF